MKTTILKGAMRCAVLSAAMAVFAGVAFGAVEFDSSWSVKGKRVININTVVRVNQIEVSRDTNRGKDEAHLHTVEAVETFRKAVSDAIPEAKVTWSFSWRALQDQRPNYVAVRKRVVEFHRQYGDEITFIPGAYFAPMYNSRAQTNLDIHDGLKLVSEMVGGGYRPHGVVAGFLAADNLRYLAEAENIHVAQGTIWSQYGIDNGDGDGSICYPYYPSREHACKPAQGKADFIDCVNLDGWTCDFLCARKFGFEGGGNSRTGVGPIETYGRLGLKDGMKETRAVVRSHFGDNFRRNGFGWIVVNWEICLVKLNKPEYTAALTQWLKGVREEFPDMIVPLMSEFGEAWRRENPNNDRLDYRFVQRGNCIHRIFSEPNLEIRWYMNRKFRLATLRDWTKNEPEMVIDFTRYDLPAKEPPDASVKKPTRNWSLINRINQKRRRPQDAPIPLSALTEEERRMVDEYYQMPDAAAAPSVEAPVGTLPSQAHLEYQRREIMALVCWGLNPYTNQEWGFGNVPLSKITAQRLDPAQWVRAMKAAEIKSVVLVAKHHDGFCLWPSKYNADYSMAAVPAPNTGRDLVRETADACRREGLKFGVYLSPWDRHRADYATPAYIDYFFAQWNELLDNYGEICEIWLDGANGGTGWYGGANGGKGERRSIPKDYYQNPRLLALLHEKHPLAVAFGGNGEWSSRWCGNEQGRSPETWWCPSKGADGREHWIPSEADFPLRRGWYWHANERPKSLEALVKAYFETVGRGAVMDIGIAPDVDGQVCEADERRLAEFGAWVRAFNATNVAARAKTSERRDGNRLAVELALPAPASFDCADIKEDIARGQRVKAFSVEVRDGKEWREVAKGTTVGYRRLARFPAVTGDRARITLDGMAPPLLLPTALRKSPSVE